MKVLFVCTGNTCRSVLAEYIAKARFSEHEFASAGFWPQTATDAENAIYTLRRLDIDASHHEPTHVKSRDLSSYNLIVAIDRTIAEKLRALGVDDARLVTWNIDDPYGDNLVEYQHCSREIMGALSQLELQ